MNEAQLLTDHLENVVNKTWNFAGRIEDDRGHQLNAVIGLASEAGEVLDEIKKLHFHTPKDRRDKIRAELGDVLYYWLKTADIFGFSLEEILADNRDKLESRHPELGRVTTRYGKDAR